MKKIILTFLFLLAFLQINAQNFSVFEMDSVRWKVFTQDLWTNPIKETFIYYKNFNDTIINGEKWLKVYKKGSPSSTFSISDSIYSDSDEYMSYKTS